jgi:hypothetical protein
MIFLSFSWLTAGYLHLIVFGDGKAPMAGLIFTAIVSLLLIGALAVTLYEIAQSSSIVKEALSVLDTMNPQ